MLCVCKSILPSTYQKYYFPCPNLVGKQPWLMTRLSDGTREVPAGRLSVSSTLVLIPLHILSNAGNYTLNETEWMCVFNLGASICAQAIKRELRTLSRIVCDERRVTSSLQTVSPFLKYQFTEMPSIHYFWQAQWEYVKESISLILSKVGSLWRTQNMNREKRSHYLHLFYFPTHYIPGLM